MSRADVGDAVYGAACVMFVVMFLWWGAAILRVLQWTPPGAITPAPEPCAAYEVGRVRLGERGKEKCVEVREWRGE